jgi:hypothetical protein
MSLRSSGLRAHVRFTAKATEFLRRREKTRWATSRTMAKAKSAIEFSLKLPPPLPPVVAKAGFFAQISCVRLVPRSL